MTKNIYELLNEVETDFSEYQEQPLSDLEKKRVKKGMKGRLYTGRESRSRFKGIAVAACLCLCAFGLAAGPMKGQVEAAVKFMSFKIGTYLGIQKDLTEYEKIVDQTVTSNGVSITLNSVILDGNQLIVSDTTAYSDPELSKTGQRVSAEVFVNGVRAMGASGSSKELENGCVESVMSYELEGVNVDGELEFELNYSGLDGEAGEVPGFAFRADGSALSANTVKIPLDQEYTLPDQTIVKLNQYTDNVIGQKIYYTVENKGINSYDLKLEGTDDLGNPVCFYLSMGNNEGGRFNIDDLQGFVQENAKLLTLTLYAVEMPKESGKMSNDYKKVGEVFSIELK